MKRNIILLISLFACLSTNAQVVCILCYDQNDSISDNVNNLILNGGFEYNNCGGTGYFCPNSSFYNCDLDDWTCTGGGTNTYAHNITNTFSMVVEGLQAAYLGNFYCNPCSNVTNDTTCLGDTACTMTDLPPGFPTNTPQQGGSTGVSLSQTVPGLTPGSTYVLEFWAGGEGSSWPNPGLFGVDVGFGDTLLRCKQTNAFSTDIGTRYLILFQATSTSHTIKFTNWGHICSDCTELIIDDVRLYPLADLSPSVPPCLGINPIALFSAPNHICPGTCTDFNNLSLNCFSFLWSFPGANPSTSTDANPTNICYNNPGTYAVSLIGSNATTSDTLTLNNYITVYPYPPAQGISQSGDTLFANAGAITYQWYYNGSLITGATNAFYIATASGDYNVVATDNNGCEVEAVIFNVLAGIEDEPRANMLTIYPNPVSHHLLIEMKAATDKKEIEVSVLNLLGEKVLVQLARAVIKPNYVLDVSTLRPGLYYLSVFQNNENFYRKFVKE